MRSTKAHLIWSLLLPPFGILMLVATLRLSGIGNLGPLLDPIAQLAILAVGFASFRRAVDWRPLFAGLLYFPLMLAVSWTLAFLVTGWLRWYEY